MQQVAPLSVLLSAVVLPLGQLSVAVLERLPAHSGTILIERSGGVSGLVVIRSALGGLCSNRSRGGPMCPPHNFLHQPFAAMWRWAVGSWLPISWWWQPCHGLAKYPVDTVPRLW